MDFRNTDDNNLFVPNEMNKTQLPTFITIYRHFLYLLTISKCIKNKIEATAISDTTNAIIGIWQSASLPQITIKSVRGKVGKLVNRVKIIKKSYKKSYYKNTVEKAKLNILFDICSCKCSVISNCQCKRDDRIPPLKITFIIDQRDKRMLFIDTTSLVDTPIQSSRKKPRLDLPSQSTSLVLHQVYNIVYLYYIYF